MMMMMMMEKKHMGPRNCFILQTIHESVYSQNSCTNAETPFLSSSSMSENDEENKFCFDCKKKLGVYLHCKFGTLLCRACAEEHKTDGQLKIESGKYLKCIFFNHQVKEEFSPLFSPMMMSASSSALEDDSDDDEDVDGGVENDENALSEEREPILTELELATLSAGGNRALSLFLKNEHGIIVGNLNAKDRVKFYKECRELRAYRVELAMASSMRMHALREEYKEFLDDYHAATESGSISSNDKSTKNKKKIRKISDSLGSALTNIDKELMEEKRREEEEERLQQEEEEEEEKSDENKREEKDDGDEPRTPDSESKEETRTTTTSSSLFSSPTSLLKSIDTSGLNKIGTWVQSITATATTKSSESGNSDKENNSDDEKETMEKAEVRPGKEEDLLDEIETIAEAAAAEVSSTGANINDKSNETNSSSNSSSDSDELLNEIDQIVAEVDDDDNSVKEKEEEERKEERNITTSSDGSSRLASSPRSVRFVKIRNEAATAVQKHWKGSNERKAFLNQKRAATTIQSSFRGNKARRGVVREMKEEVKRIEKETEAAIKIQSRFRGSKARVTIAELREEVRRKEEERVALEAKRERERVERQSAITIQKSFKGMQQRKVYGEFKACKARDHAATHIQSYYRGVKTREQVANDRKARLLLAALEKREAENEKRVRAAILLQAHSRGFLARREARELREFAKIKIEAKLYARKRVEERIEAKMNELRTRNGICA
jgi:hypothetical protein